MRTFIAISLFVATSFAALACELPAPRFSYNTKGLTVTFNNKTVGQYSNMQWAFGDGTTSNENNPQHTYQTGGTYTFSLTVGNGDSCSKTFQGKVYIFNTTKPAEATTTQPTINTKSQETINKNEQSVKIGTVVDYNTAAKGNDLSTVSNLKNIGNYPNPFETSTIIRFELNESSHLKVVVLDIWGRVVRELNNSVVESGHQQFLFERQNLTAGTYFLKITAGNSTTTNVLVIQ
jgi:PKD repeat protein